MSMQPGIELDKLVCEKVLGLSVEQADKEARGGFMPSLRISDAWEVVEHITKPGCVRNPKTGLPASSHFAFAFKARDIWAETANDAAYQICLMALEAVGIDC